MKKINLNSIAFILYLLIYIVVLEVFGFGTSIGNFRYYALVIITLLSFLYLYINRNRIKKWKCRELLYVIPLALFFLLASFIKSIQASMPLNIRTFVQISLFLLPSLYSFNIVNSLSKEEISKLIKTATIILVIAYFFPIHETKHGILEFFNIQNWLKINYLKSISFTESSYYAETFLQLFLYFFYFYESSDDEKIKKNLKPYYIINFIFTMLCFKRLGILFAIFLLLFKKKIPLQKEMKKNHSFLLAVCFVIVTILYLQFIQGKLIPGINLMKFSSGRNWILSLWAKRHYFSYGYGTSMLVIGRYLEMDLVQIYLELGIISLFLFCYVFFKIAGKKYYTNLIMIYVFVNMLTASSLPHQIGWVFLMINIALISSNESKKQLKEVYHEKVQYIIDKISKKSK